MDLGNIHLGSIKTIGWQVDVPIRKLVDSISSYVSAKQPFLSVTQYERFLKDERLFTFCELWSYYYNGNHQPDTVGQDRPYFPVSQDDPGRGFCTVDL